MKTNHSQLKGKAPTPAAKAPATSSTIKKIDEQIKAAHDQADKDIEGDPDFKPHPKTHDLDEGEIARLGDE